MTVSDLIALLQQQDPHAIVVLQDPPFPDSIAKLGAGEVTPVRLQASEDVGLTWLRVSEQGGTPGLLLGRST